MALLLPATFGTMVTSPLSTTQNKARMISIRWAFHESEAKFVEFFPSSPNIVSVFISLLGLMVMDELDQIFVNVFIGKPIGFHFYEYSYS
jgi:hypothetical protein